MVVWVRAKGKQAWEKEKEKVTAAWAAGQGGKGTLQSVVLLTSVTRGTLQADRRWRRRATR